MQIKLRHGVGYTGRLGEHAYVARILGTDDQYGLLREFIAAEKVERDSFTKRKYIRTFTFDLTEGLYEVSAEGNRDYTIVYFGRRKSDDPGTEERLIRISGVQPDRAEAIAKMLTEGADFNTARKATMLPVL